MKWHEWLTLSSESSFISALYPIDAAGPVHLRSAHTHHTPCKVCILEMIAAGVVVDGWGDCISFSNPNCEKIKTVCLASQQCKHVVCMYMRLT